MFKTQRHFNEREDRRQISLVVKQRLIVLTSFLCVVLLVLLFKVGETWWPSWMIGHQKQIMGILLLAIICVVVLSPLIVEADTNPRALSGPGKNPKGPRLE